MSQGGPVSELVALLTNSMSPEKPTREAAEKILLETAEQKPSEIVPAFLDALKGMIAT